MSCMPGSLLHPSELLRPESHSPASVPARSGTGPSNPLPATLPQMRLRSGIALVSWNRADSEGQFVAPHDADAGTGMELVLQLP